MRGISFFIDILFIDKAEQKIDKRKRTDTKKQSTKDILRTAWSISMFLLMCSVLIIRLFNAKRTHNEALAISLLFYYLIIIFLPLMI